MTETNAKLSGPDFARGISLTSVEDSSLLLGHAHGERVILVRRGDLVHAIGAVCHANAPGRLVDPINVFLSTRSDRPFA